MTIHNAASPRLYRCKKAILLLFFTLATLTLVGCGGSSNDSRETAELRVVHASPDAPEVNVILDSTRSIEQLDYSESSGFVTIDAGSARVRVEGIIPGGNADVIDVPNLSFPEDSRTTIFAIDKVASIAPLVVAESASTPTSTEVAINVIHAAPDAPPVDVYVTAPGDDINAANPNFSFAFTEAIDAGSLPAGPVQIRVTLATTKTVVYDSGTVDLTGFGGESILLAAIATTNATSTFSAPIKLLAITDSATVTLLDTNTTAGVRVVHASPDAANAAGGPVEVFATSQALGVNPVELIDTFDYTDIVPNASSNVPVPAADDYQLDVAPDTDDIADSVFNVSNVSLAQGEEYSVIAAGRVLSTPAFGLLLTEDDNRSVVTQASLKVIHAAPAAGDVDIYVTPAGTTSVAEIENNTTTAQPALTSFAFGTITDYIPLAVGTYDVRVVAGGMVAINVEGLDLTAGLVATAISSCNSEPDGAPTDFGLILLTN